MGQKKIPATSPKVELYKKGGEGQKEFIEGATEEIMKEEGWSLDVLPVKKRETVTR